MNTYRTQIIREACITPEIDTLFINIEKAKQWLKENTGCFDNNEILCIVDHNLRKTAWVKLQTTIIVEDI